MKVIIIDDSAVSVEQLAKKLKFYDDITLCATADTGMKGIPLVKQYQPDVVFLDVELPDMTGLELLGQLSPIVKSSCKVVIYTAHDTYMLPAFRSKAFDFLLKPIDDHDLQEVMRRVYLEDNKPMAVSGQKEPEKLMLSVNASDFRVVNILDVGLFQYNHDLRLWEVIVAGSKEPVRLKRSTNNEALLAMHPSFVQVSQRHIININYLMEVCDSCCRLFPPFDHIDDIKVGRTFRKQLTDRFNTL